MSPRDYRHFININGSLATYTHARPSHPPARFRVLVCLFDLAIGSASSRIHTGCAGRRAAQGQRANREVNITGYRAMPAQVESATTARRTTGTAVDINAQRLVITPFVNCGYQKRPFRYATRSRPRCRSNLLAAAYHCSLSSGAKNHLPPSPIGTIYKQTLYVCVARHRPFNG